MTKYSSIWWPPKDRPAKTTGSPMEPPFKTNWHPVTNLFCYLSVIVESFVWRHDCFSSSLTTGWAISKKDLCFEKRSNFKKVGNLVPLLLKLLTNINMYCLCLAVIRECFPTSILLGSIEDPVEPTEQCSPVPVESDTIKGRNRAVLTCTCGE